ncbi:hypothetical protein TSAR_014004, partial [Trichomalopsis sarcophagae]
EDWGFNYHLSEDRKIDRTIFEKVVKLCGLHITRIDFSKYYDYGRKQLTANKSPFKSIEMFCPNLTAIDIRAVTVTLQGLECLAKSCLIDTCDYLNFPNVIVEPLSLFFKNNQNLRRVIFHVLYAENCLHAYSVGGIEVTSIMRLPKIRELCLCDLEDITDLIFFDCASPLKISRCSQCPGLRNFGSLQLVQSSTENLQILVITDCENTDLEELIQVAGTDNRIKSESGCCAPSELTAD